MKAYFERRYRSHSTLQLEHFKGLVDDTPIGSNFLSSESEKLEIELEHAKMYHLRYLEYEYYLDFGDILFDSESQSVTVPVVEGHDVEFEISREIAKNGPVISKMRNLQHTITLRKENGDWKIVSDDYEDYLWRLIKATRLSKEDLVQPDEDSPGHLPGIDGAMSETTSCNLYGDQSTYPYNYTGAVEYAHQWALSPNPAYYYFPEPWGDCTNFVSQAMYEGGGALMDFDDEHGIGMDGWYYNNVNDRAAAWVDVTRLYNFIVNRPLAKVMILHEVPDCK
ncbi:MAG: amidase domain-containing protein [Anaerolineales bacterium]|nr:amidase domain-containing protein [Anaerolineales bacterium]